MLSKITLPELPTGLVIVKETTEYQAPPPLKLDNYPIILPPGVYRISDDYKLILKVCNIEDYT